MGFGNGEQLYEMRDRAAIAENADIALQIAHAAKTPMWKRSTER